MLRVLLTNDDGIGATGLQTLRRALLKVDEIELVTIAPDSNRSATARSITFSRPLWVTDVDFEDGTRGYACDGTPVDCVRLAALGLIEGFEPDLVVSGINHGSNLGDDITYSGTVAAALEGVVLGLPAIAVSQQSAAREMDFRLGETFEFEDGARFVARVVEQRVVDVVVDVGIVEDVVAVVVVLELAPQLLSALCGLLRAHSISAEAGASSASRSNSRRASMPGACVRSKCRGVTAMRPAATAARSVPASSRKLGSSP